MTTKRKSKKAPSTSVEIILETLADYTRRLRSLECGSVRDWRDRALSNQEAELIQVRRLNVELADFAAKLVQAASCIKLWIPHDVSGNPFEEVTAVLRNIPDAVAQRLKEIK